VRDCGAKLFITSPEGLAKSKIRALFQSKRPYKRERGKLKKGHRAQRGEKKEAGSRGKRGGALGGGSSEKNICVIGGKGEKGGLGGGGRKSERAAPLDRGISAWGRNIERGGHHMVPHMTSHRDDSNIDPLRNRIYRKRVAGGRGFYSCGGLGGWIIG